MAAPMPRDAPVTSAQPSFTLPASAIAVSRSRAPPRHPRSPGEARPERREEHVRAERKTAVSDRSLERDRERGGGGIADFLDAVDDAFGCESEPVAERARDPRVRLVVDEKVDVLEVQTRALKRLHRDLPHAVDRVAEDLGTVHVDLALLMGDEDGAGVRAV